jgi:hypothetical protein
MENNLEFDMLGYGYIARWGHNVLLAMMALLTVAVVHLFIQ